MNLQKVSAPCRWRERMMTEKETAAAYMRKVLARAAYDWLYEKGVKDTISEPLRDYLLSIPVNTGSDDDDDNPQTLGDA